VAPPPLSDKHRTFLARVKSLCEARGNAGEFTVVSEWLGYLPFGVYVWIELATAGVSDSELADPWDSGDIEALIRDGYLEVVDRKVLSQDGFDTRTTCRFTPQANATLLA
jgi:hypothetical protein